MTDAVLHPSRVVLARHIANDLTATERRDLSRHLASCPTCRGRLARMTAASHSFEARRAHSLALLRWRLAQAQPAPPIARLVLPAGALAAVLALVVIHAGITRAVRRPPTTADTRAVVAAPMYKGTLGLQVYARRAKRQFRVRQGMRLTCGDELRFAATTATAGYLTVFSLDGDDKLTPFYPDSSPDTNPRPLRVSRPGRQLLPGGITLDDAVGPEQLVVVFAQRPFDREVVHRRVAGLLRRLGPAALSARALGLSGEVVVLGVRKDRCAE
jgi:hypothetical protein